jgi:uncharacterized protein (TIGR02328 family)
MRLWHESLIPYLDNKRLLGQHRECCALRGNGWGKKHSTVDYVFTHHPILLYHYHFEVMEEMRQRGFSVNSQWLDCTYRGKSCLPYGDYMRKQAAINASKLINSGGLVYPEHNDEYLVECLENLKRKGI